MTNQNWNTRSWSTGEGLVVYATAFQDTAVLVAIVLSSPQARRTVALS